MVPHARDAHHELRQALVVVVVVVIVVYFFRTAAQSGHGDEHGDLEHLDADLECRRWGGGGLRGEGGRGFEHAGGEAAQGRCGRGGGGRRVRRRGAGADAALDEDGLGGEWLLGG